MRPAAVNMAILSTETSESRPDASVFFSGRIRFEPWPRTFHSAFLPGLLLLSKEIQEYDLGISYINFSPSKWTQSIPFDWLWIMTSVSIL